MYIVERDKWYFVIDCIRCQRSTVLNEARGPMAESIPENFSWKCPYCSNRQNGREQVQLCQGIYI